MARIRGRMASFLVAAFHHAKLDNSADCKKRFAKRFMTSFLQGVRKVGHMVQGPDKMGKPSVRINYARNSGLVKVAAAAVAKRAADKDAVAAARAAEVVDKKTSDVDAAFKIGGDATLAQRAKARNAQVVAQAALRVAVAAAAITAFALVVAVAAVPESAKDGLVASLARFAPVAIPEPVATAIAQGVATKTAEAEAAIKKVIKGLLDALNVFWDHHRKQWAGLDR
ncbi:hypothetical protein BC828DRAFT_416295 [Blastocladiella britannica]|nr:hypothetical protein BC828DRAFT_416295 [Blastocladiella britannica]